MHNQLCPVLVCRKGTPIASLCKVCPWSRFDFFGTVKLDKMHQIYTQAWRLHLTWQDLRMDFRLSRAPGERISLPWILSEGGGVGEECGQMRKALVAACFFKNVFFNVIYAITLQLSLSFISLLVMLPSTSFMQRLCSVHLFLSVLGLWQQRSSKAFHIALPHIDIAMSLS